MNVTAFMSKIPESANTIDTMIYPRSPREKMAGWVHLPRFIDKLRLQSKGLLGEEYKPNVGKGFDAAWLKASGVEFEEFKKLVLDSPIDGEICDWVLKNVKKSEAEKEAFHKDLLKYGTHGETLERLIMRKKESGMEDRDDIQCMFDYIDADEERT